MQIIHTIEAFKQIRKDLTGRLGFIPTMGALHKGHASLISKAQQENDYIVTSIFVNPLQFNDINDYKNYPNTIEEDISFLEKMKVNYLFLPNKNFMYAHQFHFTIETEHPMAKCLEGKFRPGHFRGMLTIVLKLLLGILPSRAYFGEKDFQQYLLVKAMIEDLFIDTEIILCPTIREKSGLPVSSRNKLLSSDELRLANTAFQLLHQVTPQTLSKVKDELTFFGVNTEYIEIVDDRVFLAIKINSTRLIDNFKLKEALK